MKNVLFIEYIFYKCILITRNVRVENNFRIFFAILYRKCYLQASEALIEKFRILPINSIFRISYAT